MKRQRNRGHVRVARVGVPLLFLAGLASLLLPPFVRQVAAGCNAPGGNKYTLGVALVSGPDYVCSGGQGIWTVNVSSDPAASAGTVSLSGDATGSAPVPAGGGNVQIVATVGSTASTSLNDKSVTINVDISADANNGPCKATTSDSFTVLKVDIVDAGKYIVPGSTNNAIRYRWTPTTIAPTSVRMEIYDKTNNLVRTISSLPTSFLSTNAWAEQKWNGMKDDAGTLPLTETNSPYALKIIGTWSGTECSASTNAAVEAWLLDIGIEDQPLASETLVTGVDEESVTNSNLEVWVSLNSNTEVSVAFSVSNDTEVSTGPASNQWGCLVTPTNFLFYTTPLTPYDIRYRVRINQKTSTNSVPDHGIEVHTVIDDTLNLWDMDPGTGNRQTNTVWEFGIDSTGAPPAAVRRNLTEVYQ